MTDYSKMTEKEINAAVEDRMKKEETVPPAFTAVVLVGIIVLVIWMVRSCNQDLEEFRQRPAYEAITIEGHEYIRHSKGWSYELIHAEHCSCKQKPKERDDE